VVEYGPAEEVFRRPRHAYTRTLFEAAPGRHFRFGAA
jgi:peptide/nickel transport system ATP-binding protein